MRGLSSRPRLGDTGGRAPVALVKVGSSCGSFPFSRCLHPSPDQHPGPDLGTTCPVDVLWQIWGPLWPDDTLSSTRHQVLETIPPKDDCHGRASHKGNNARVSLTSSGPAAPPASGRWAASGGAVAQKTFPLQKQMCPFAHYSGGFFNLSSPSAEARVGPLFASGQMTLPPLSLGITVGKWGG